MARSAARDMIYRQVPMEPVDMKEPVLEGIRLTSSQTRLLSDDENRKNDPRMMIEEISSSRRSSSPR